MKDPFDKTAGRASIEHLTAASEDVDRALTVMGSRMSSIVNAMNGWPAGRGFDVLSSPSSVSFCEEHEKERCDCGGGTTYVNLSDPTGRAALLRDGAKSDHDRVVALAKAMRNQASELVGILGRYSQRTATDLERQATHGDSERDDRACVSCARWQVSRGVAKWEPAFSRLALSEGADPSWLCQWCWRWVRSEGRLPPVTQVERHHRGERIRKPA